MMPEKTKHIICAVWGGPQSRNTVTRAIDLALEHDARLTFFYVADAEFQAQAAIGSPISVVYRELVQMAEFSMLILVDRAQRRGVEDADFLIREGNVRKQLLQFASETDADLWVMGAPFHGLVRTTLGSQELDSFVTELKQVAHPRLILVPPPEQ
jgi:nucleotide-binding universal stress UspA family protein